MADFVQVMKDWRRMCSTIQSENKKTPFESWCHNCPIEQFCVIDTEINDLTDNVFRVIDERIQSWAAEHPEPVYPTMAKYLEQFGITIRRDGTVQADFFKANEPMSETLAKKLGVEPKEE